MKSKCILPNQKYLRDNGFGGLYQSMRQYPEKFAHIRQKYKGCKIVSDWIKIADKLTKKNNGTLPPVIWLINNGYSGLTQCMKKHPEEFKHIKQEKFFKTLDEWVDVANKLSMSNNGVLPNSRWLRDNNYVGLNTAINKCPNKFAHIKQNYKGGKTINEWVAVAEQLAQNNGGVLRGQRWLSENGYWSVAHYIRKYPKRFSHIKQKKLRKTIEEQIKIAEKLLKQNNNILYSSSWLRQNGYSGLWHAINRYPKKFGGIKQECHIGIEKYNIIGE